MQRYKFYLTYNNFHINFVSSRRLSRQTLREQKGSALYSINRQFKKYNEAQRTAHIKWVALLCVCTSVWRCFRVCTVGAAHFFIYKLRLTKI